MERDKPIVIITGSNRGIGYSILENFILSKYDATYIMTTRKLSNSEEPIKSLNKLSQEFNPHIIPMQLDLLDNTSIESFINEIEVKFGQITVLVNNSGTYFKGKPNKRIIDITMGTNFNKTVFLIESFLKKNLIQKGGKIINISSELGSVNILQKRNPEMLNELIEYKSNNYMTIESVKEFAETTQNEMKDQKLRKKWPDSVYSISKLYLTIYTYMLAKFKPINDNEIRVYSCSPGWCQTRMTKGTEATKTALEGAKTAVYLTLNEGDSLAQGEFYLDSELYDITTV